MTLRIADDLALPLDAVTQPIAILARRGAGKTYTATVFVEEVIRAQVPVVVLDPTGAWWGLRSSVDGQHPGLPVVIFGGDHADVPLEPTAGKVIAEVVLEHPGAYIVDLTSFESKAAEQQFAADFLERLYRGKRRETGPLLLVVDEADVFAPQQPRDKGNQLRTLGALEAIVRRARIKGLGDLLISQRAAVLNKNVLTQTEILIAMQTTGPQDRAAIDEWVRGNGTAEERAEVLESLASLDRGEAWVWSPSFLRILQRVRIRARTTFDSSRTPEVGEVAVEARTFAPVDLAALGERITATVEQAKANDPAELRRRIRDLEQDLARRPTETVTETITERVEVPVLQSGELERLEAVLADIANVGGRLHDIVGEVRVELRRATGAAVDARPVVPAAPPRPAPTPAPTQPPTTPEAPRSADGVALSKAERAFLSALAQFPQGRTKQQIGVATGYKIKASIFRNTLSSLRTKGLIESTGDEGIRITAGGLALVGDVPAPPTGDALVAWWLGRLSKAERAFLRHLVVAYPSAVAKHDLATSAGYEPGASIVRNSVSRLRTLGLATGNNELSASADLVEPARV